MYFEPEENEQWERCGKKLRNEKQIVQVVSRLIFRDDGGVKPKKDERPVITAIRIVLIALSITE